MKKILEMPWVREEVVDILCTLSDKEYQQRVWVRKELPPGVKLDNFTLVVNVLFDDLWLYDNPQWMMSCFLYSQEEMALVSKVIDALHSVLECLGAEATDQQYIESPQWPVVIKYSKNALLLFKDNDKKFGLNAT